MSLAQSAQTMDDQFPQSSNIAALINKRVSLESPETARNESTPAKAGNTPMPPDKNPQIATAKFPEPKIAAGRPRTTIIDEKLDS